MLLTPFDVLKSYFFGAAQTPSSGICLVAADSAIVAMHDVVAGALLEAPSDHQHVRSHGYADKGGPTTDAATSTNSHSHSHDHSHDHGQVVCKKKARVPLPSGSATAKKASSEFNICEMPVSVACARCHSVLGSITVLH